MKFNLKNFESAVEVSRLANIQYFEFTNEYHTVMHNHDFRELVYVDCGTIIVESENFLGKISNNELIIHRPDEMHTLYCTGDISPNVIIIGFESKCDKLDDFSSRSITLSPACQNTLAEIIKEGIKVFMPPYDVPYTTDMKKRESFQFGADQMIKLKLEMLLIELIRSSELPVKQNRIPTVVQKSGEVYEYINENYRANIKLSDLCFLFGTNKTTLCNSFKTAYGDSIVNYINKLRIKEAKRLMRNGNESLTEIAEKTGFSSLHYFSRCFKKIENKSPTDYIKSVKAKLNI